MIRPAAVLFDLDGVLIDSYDVWFSVMNAAARHFGYPPVTAEAFRESWGQGMEADRETFFPRHEVEELAAWYDAHFADHLEHLVVSPGVPALFARLHARGLPSAVVTNTPNPLARELVVRAGARVDAVVGANDVARAKPAPDMVLHACALLGVEPARALLVGDSRFDRDAARGAGVRFAGLGIDGDLRLERLEQLEAHL
jgi:HAD superfamily hydrolase (TIGR01509 family)